VVGALLNYFILGKWLGRPFLEKYGKYILITPEKYEKTEKIFLQNDKIYTFIGRLIPVVRHLISIPAGIFRMPLTPFVSITFA
jgi:membrane protein DedA with SNARE-associated domain